MAIHSIRDNGGEPNTWEVKLFANISGSEEFLMQLAMEMPELVDASMIHGANRDKLKEAIMVISVEGLMPAFEHLKKIRDRPDIKCLSLTENSSTRTSRVSCGTHIRT